MVGVMFTLFGSLAVARPFSKVATPPSVLASSVCEGSGSRTFPHGQVFNLSLF